RTDIADAERSALVVLVCPGNRFPPVAANSAGKSSSQGELRDDADQRKRVRTIDPAIDLVTARDLGRVGHAGFDAEAQLAGRGKRREARAGEIADRHDGLIGNPLRVEQARLRSYLVATSDQGLIGIGRIGVVADVLLARHTALEAAADAHAGAGGDETGI